MNLPLRFLKYLSPPSERLVQAFGGLYTVMFLLLLTGIGFGQMPLYCALSELCNTSKVERLTKLKNAGKCLAGTRYKANGRVTGRQERNLGSNSFLSDPGNQDSTMCFEDKSGLIANLPGLMEGSAAWGDYDNDGRLDLFVSGNQTAEGEGFSALYRNTGSGFEAQTTLLPNLPSLGSNAAAWGDYDNDGRLDLMVTGGNYLLCTSKLYHNTGSEFVDQSSLIQDLPPIWNGSLAWGDYDNDGRIDLLLTGRSLLAAEPVTKLYRNTPDGFKDQSGLISGLPGVEHSAVAWGDYDSDGWLDMMLTGYVGAGQGSISKLYHNTGTGFEDESVRLPELPGVSDGSLAWGDYDSDGRLDLMLTGGGATGPVSKLYQNTGNGFTDQSSQLPDLLGVRYSTVIWGDYDNDGRLDLLLTGDSGSELITRLYRNTNAGFESISLADAGIPNLSVSATTFGDYDNDGKLDLFLTGFTSAGPVSRLVYNLSPVANTVPTAPTSLSSQVSGGQKVKLSWQTATDAQTSKAGLTYNLYVSDRPGGQQIMSPMADQKTGYRRVVRLGNSQNTRFTLTGLTSKKTYYWSVQAIDGAFEGSPFAPEQSFTTSMLDSPEMTLQLTTPLYDCQTGAFTFQTIGGDDSLIEYAAPGITAWTGNPRQFVDQGLRQAADAQPITLLARQSNKVVRYVWDIRQVCPVGDPNQFRLTGPLYDCQSGAFTFQTQGGDGSPIDYMAVGITSWTKYPNQYVDAELRTAADAQPITLRARQNGTQARYVWDIRALCPVFPLEDHCPCPGCCVGSARQGARAEPRVALQAEVFPNPVQSELNVRIDGVLNRKVTLTLINLRGQAVVERKLETDQSAHWERLPVEGLPSGEYLFRVRTDRQQVTLKVIKQ